MEWVVPRRATGGFSQVEREHSDDGWRGAEDGVAFLRRCITDKPVNGLGRTEHTVVCRAIPSEIHRECLIKSIYVN